MYTTLRWITVELHLLSGVFISATDDEAKVTNINNCIVIYTTLRWLTEEYQSLSGVFVSETNDEAIVTIVK